MNVPTINDRLDRFPQLKTDPNFRLNSPFDQRYNCIAYASNKTDRFLWPALKDGLDWPSDVPFDDSIPSFIALFEKQEYVQCAGAEYEDKFQKIAIYEKDGKTSHASKQLADGRWVSKMGNLEDIIHSNPESLNGPGYGAVKVIMKRPNESFILAKAKYAK